MREKIQDFSNSSFLTAARHWLIKKIAGDHMVVLNARIDIVNRYDYPEGTAASIGPVDGGLVAGVVFPAYGDTLIKLSGNRHK